ncbi:MAG: RNA polymerase sigma factor [Rubripirellula sp.]
MASLLEQTDLEHDNQTLDASADFVRDWYGRVYAQCQAKLRSRSDAEDAVQEVFLRGLVGLDRLKCPQAIGGWLRGIAHHVCVDVIRRDQRQRALQDSLESSFPIESNAEIDRDEQSRLIALIHGLPEVYRETILLHYFENMTYDEIADWLGVARSTVNERLSKGRRKLKQQLLADQCNDEV